jgi:hypothetical protein
MALLLVPVGSHWKPGVEMVCHASLHLKNRLFYLICPGRWGTVGREYARMETRKSISRLWQASEERGHGGDWEASRRGGNRFLM